LIVGGGYVATEFGHFFSAVGTDVTIIGRNPYLVKEEDPDVSEILKQELSKRMHVYTNHEVIEAKEEAKRFSHDYIGTEHILLGLIKEGEGVAAAVLTSLGLDSGNIRLEVEKLVQPGPSKVMTDDIPFTPRAKKVIELAMDEARNLGHNYIGTEHLLLGLIREGDGVASQVLLNMGLDLKSVRDEVLNLLGASVPGYSVEQGAKRKRKTRSEQAAPR